MAFFDLDTQALQIDIRQLVAECIRCKRLLGATWSSRGRQHLRDADANLVIALRTAPGYTAVAMGAAQ